MNGPVTPFLITDQSASIVPISFSSIFVFQRLRENYFFYLLTWERCCRQSRLIQEHFDTDPATIAEEQLRDYILHTAPNNRLSDEQRVPDMNALPLWRHENPAQPDRMDEVKAVRRVVCDPGANYSPGPDSALWSFWSFCGGLLRGVWRKLKL
jgi:hypothetical protein